MFMLAYNPLASRSSINNNEWSFPLLEIIITSAGVYFIDRHRGAGRSSYARSGDVAITVYSQLAKDMAPWTLVGLLIMLTTGPMIFSSDPNMYLANPSFMFKMYALLAAIIFNYTIHRKVSRGSNSSEGLTKLVAVVSLALWVSVVAGGLFIAFV